MLIESETTIDSKFVKQRFKAWSNVLLMCAFFLYAILITCKNLKIEKCFFFTCDHYKKIERNMLDVVSNTNLGQINM